MLAPTQEKCGICNRPLIAWTYLAAEGDMMFHPKTNVPLVVIEGHGKLTKRAALVCQACDRIDRFPRRDNP